MVKNIIAITSVIVCLSSLLSSAKVQTYKVYDDGEFHRSVQNIEPKIGNNTYFLITAQTHLSANTGASVVINAYNDMRKVSKYTPIYFVLNNNGGVLEKDIEWYFKNVYKIPLEADPNFLIIRNDSLYNHLQYGGPLTKMFYVYNELLLYKNNAKHHFITDANLPIHKFYVKEKYNVQLQSGDTKLSYMDMFLPYKTSQIAYLTDIQNRLVIFDLKTGKITKKYTNHKSGTQYYCDLIAKNNSECDTAKKYVKITDDLNRKSYYLFNFFHDNDKVYLSAGIQVFVRLHKDKIIITDENKKKVYPKGELFGYGYQTFAVLDSNLNDLGHYYLPEDIGPDKDIVPSIDFGFYVSKDGRKLISPAGHMKDKFPKEFNKLIMQLNIDNKKCSFDKYLDAEMSDHYRVSLNSNLYDYFCEHNGKLLFMTDNENLIYDVKSKLPVTKLSGDGTEKVEEIIPKYTEETDELVVNFMPVAISSSDNKLYVIYKYKDKYLLEIKDENYITKDIINLSFIKYLKSFPEDECGENIKLDKNYIYIKYLKGDEYHVSLYDINSL